MMNALEIKDLYVSIGDKEIIRGLTLTVPKGEVHAIMGPNGSGKSTLSKAIGGHPDYSVTSGDVLLDGQSILGLEPDARSRAGLFLAFQYPMAIPVVSNANFIRAALQAPEPPRTVEPADYRQRYAILTGHRIDLCPICGGRMVEIGHSPHSPRPRRSSPRCDTS